MQETIINNVWPLVEQLVGATINEDGEAVANLLAPNEQAADMLELFGVAVFDILLKTVLGRGGVSVTQAIETDNDAYPIQGVSHFIQIEYAWLTAEEGENQENQLTAVDAVSIKFMQVQNQWKAVEINPSSIDLSLTNSRARQILATVQILSEDDKVPAEPWILPIALYGGMLQLPIEPAALQDEVEKQLLAGLQKRGYGVTILVDARRLWREFRALDKLDLKSADAGIWAAAVEYVMSELNQRNQTQSAIGKLYKVSLSDMGPCIKQIKKSSLFLSDKSGA